MARPNKIDDNYSMYALRIATKDLADIKQLSKKLSDDTDTQISNADIMRQIVRMLTRRLRDMNKKLTTVLS